MESKTSGGFNWSADVNWFLNRSEITELGSGVKIDAVNGWGMLDLRSMRSGDYKKIGIWQTGEETDATALGGFKPGNIKVEDLERERQDRCPTTGWYWEVFSPSGRVVSTSRMSFKGFNLDVILFAKIGGMLVSTLYWKPTRAILTTRSKEEGTDQTLTIGLLTTRRMRYPRPGQAQQPVYGSTLGYFDATYMEIRSINLSYNLPSSWLEKAGIGGIRIYAQAQNPF